MFMRYIITCFVFILSACSNIHTEYAKADNALDAGRGFIDACLKGDFVKASFYMIPDEKNKDCLIKLERQYREKNRDGRRQYREASINIIEIANPTEAETIINYRNSYDRIAHKLKVIQQENRWLVDFKYTFNPNL